MVSGEGRKQISCNKGSGAVSFNTVADGYDVQAVAFAAAICTEGRERGCSAQLHPVVVNAHSTGPWRDKAPKAHTVRLCFAG